MSERSGDPALSEEEAGKLETNNLNAKPRDNFLARDAYVFVI